MKQIEVFCDGGSRGNPGHAGVGIVINKGNQIKISKYIGIATNNQAEYNAVIEALKYINENPQVDRINDIDINFYLDSQLVVEQLNGNYKIKNEGLKPLYSKVQELKSKIKNKITFTHVLREKNNIADKLVNRAIDKKIK